MPKKDNVTLGIDWRFGPDWPGRRCGAKTRRGTACQRPANKKNGHCRLHGVACIGPTCLLQVCDTDGDVRVVVSSSVTQCLDRAFFTHFSLDLAAAQIICVKSTVHFRADFDSVARNTLPVAAPGLFPCRLDEIPYRNARRRWAKG